MAGLDDIFDLIDQNGDNDIAFDEVLEFLGVLPDPPDEDQIRQWYKEADADGSGGIDRAELENILLKVESECSTSVNDVVSSFKQATYRKLFRTVDEDGGGSLDKGEVAKLLDALPVKATDQDIREAIAAADADGNGVLDEDEFACVLERFTRGVVITQVLDAFKKERAAAIKRYRDRRAAFLGKPTEEPDITRSPPRSPRSPRACQKCTEHEKARFALEAELAALREKASRLQQQLDAQQQPEPSQQPPPPHRPDTREIHTQTDPLPEHSPPTPYREPLVSPPPARSRSPAPVSLQLRTPPARSPSPAAASPQRLHAQGGVPLCTHPLADKVKIVPWANYLAHSPARSRSPSPAAAAPSPGSRSRGGVVSPAVEAAARRAARCTPERRRGEWSAGLSSLSSPGGFSGRRNRSLGGVR
eukprot:Hpha_TRINITY_DN4846_c0_g1::TRINITY_DN4846_c0_g1_i1::g.20296::m.20296